jgi:CubicO group peptidase (beta-lactamase class C family)
MNAIGSTLWKKPLKSVEKELLLLIIMQKLLFLFIVIVLGLASTSFHSLHKTAKNSITNRKFWIEQRLEENSRKNAKNQVVDLAYKEFKIDSIFRNLSSHNRFNGCVLVAQHGQIIYKNSFGIANPILNEPLNTNSVFQLASVSKTITGVAVLQLIEDEKLGLDDFVSLYFPSFPYSTVTVRNLLSHTSGIPDYIKLSPSLYSTSTGYITNEDALNGLISANLPPSFTPGTRFRYNNSNYAILALLVEKITGVSFPQYVKTNIFGPLGMSNSFVAHPEKIWEMSNRTFGFSGRSMASNDMFDGVFGDKGAYSTVEDMYKFDRALYPDILLKEETLKLAFTNNVFDTRSSKKYGLGFRLREDQNNQKIIYHNGWWHGYRTAFHRRESDNSCVIILSNRLDRCVYAQAKQLFNILDNYYMGEMSEGEHDEPNDE